MGRGSRVLGVLVVSIAAWAASAVVAQTEAPRPDETLRLAGEIAGVNRSLGEIRDVLRSLLRSQRAQVALRRIELAERRLAPLAAELQDARGSLRSTREEISRMEAMQEEIEGQIETAVREGRVEEMGSEREMLRQIETMLRSERDRLDAAERRVRELEDDLGRGRDRIAILDERLDQLLEGD